MVGIETFQAKGSIFPLLLNDLIIKYKQLNNTFHKKNELDVWMHWQWEGCPHTICVDHSCFGRDTCTQQSQNALLRCGQWTSRRRHGLLVVNVIIICVCVVMAATKYYLRNFNKHIVLIKQMYALWLKCYLNCASSYLYNA